MPITITYRPAPRITITPDDGAALTVTAPAQPGRVTISARGPQGAPGPASAFFEHVQAVASDAWTINHNLGFRPAVTVFSPGGVEVEADVIHVSVNQTVIAFAAPQAGSARFN